MLGVVSWRHGSWIMVYHVLDLKFCVDVVLACSCSPLHALFPPSVFSVGSSRVWNFCCELLVGELGNMLLVFGSVFLCYNLLFGSTVEHMRLSGSWSCCSMDWLGFHGILGCGLAWESWLSFCWILCSFKLNLDALYLFWVIFLIWLRYVAVRRMKKKWMLKVRRSWCQYAKFLWQ